MRPRTSRTIATFSILAALLVAVVLFQPPAATAHEPDPGDCTADGGHAHISIGDGVANENDSTITFVITCHPCGKVNANSWWTTSDGTAMAPGDYTAKTQMFTLGTTADDTQTYNFVVTLNDDVMYEGDESFTVGLGGEPAEEANPSVLAPCLYLDDPTATGTIQENDPVNTPPVADAGGPYSVDEGSSVMLDGSGSSDPDAGPNPLSYAWNFDGDGMYDDATGVMPTFSAASLDGPSSVPIGLEVDDGAATDTDTGTVNVQNVAPTVATPSVTPEPSDEGSSATASATFTDPAPDDSPFTCTVDYGEGDGAVAGTVNSLTCDGPSHSYGDNGSYTVKVCVTDKDGGTGCTSTSHQVSNVAPTVATPSVTDEPSDEGSSASVSATFTDPGTDDSPFTCTIDYGVGAGGVSATVSSMTCSGSFTWGDNGSYTVKVCVTDKDGGTGCKSTSHVVSNVDPEVTLDTTGAVSFPGGDAFLGRQGDSQSHDADGSDPGSDDLTFDWDFGFTGSEVSTTYYNDTGSTTGTPDPAMSPGGTFPFEPSDSASVTFSAPGFYTVRVDLTDDDGGSDYDDFPKLVTGDLDCTRSQGFWKHELSGHGQQHFDATTLQAFIDIVEFASSVFDEVAPTDFASNSPDLRTKATHQALAAWLNFAAGAVGWTEVIDVDGDTVPDTPAYMIFQTIEGILTDTNATDAELEMAKDLAEVINLLDESNPECTEEAP